MTEWRLKNGARLRFLRQYSQGGACSPEAAPAGLALQACARSLLKAQMKTKVTQLPQVTSSSHPSATLIPDLLCIQEEAPGVDLRASTSVPADFLPPYSCNCRWGWFTCTGGSHSTHNISLADGSSDKKAALRSRSMTMTRMMLASSDYRGGVRGWGRRWEANRRVSSYVGDGPSAWKQAEEVRLFLWSWLGLSYSGHMDGHTGKKRSDAQKRVQAEERLPP